MEPLKKIYYVRFHLETISNYRNEYETFQRERHLTKRDFLYRNSTLLKKREFKKEMYETIVCYSNL